jgi:hypothetical protein
MVPRALDCCQADGIPFLKNLLEAKIFIVVLNFIVPFN